MIKVGCVGITFPAMIPPQQLQNSVSPPLVWIFTRAAQAGCSSSQVKMHN